MGTDLLNLARTGVMASQAQLGVTSNNIANVNTKGYHRQVSQQSAQLSQRIGGNFYGTGTYVSEVKRIYNEYVSRELRIGHSTLSYAETRHAKLTELDEIFSQVGRAIPQSLTDLYADLAGLADLPDDLGVRDGVLNSANQLASAIKQMQTNLDSQFKQTNEQIVSIVEQVNKLGKELVDVNNELMKSSGQDMQLQDKQELLLQELGQFAQINVIPHESGAKSVMLGGSVTLVSGQNLLELGTQDGDPFPLELELNMLTNNQSVDGSKLGGQLGALFEYREQTLNDANLKLGQLALGVADTFNQLQSQGFDLDGQVGSRIFTDVNAASMSAGRVGAKADNTGNAILSVSIDDVTKLTASAYELSFTAPATYELKDETTGSVQNLTLSGTTLTGADGFSIDIDSGTLATGDRFVIRPTATAAAAIEVELVDPRGIAAAGSANKITADPTNAGNISVDLVNINNRNAANFPVTGSELTFIVNSGLNQYIVTDANGATIQGATFFTPPSISDFGFTFDVTSTANSVESFTFDLSFSSGDNTNALAMSRLNEASLMNKGTSSFVDLFENLKLNTGSKAKAAAISQSSAEAIFEQAQSRLESSSGVNLDEEAANLMRFQQSYQAAARIMTTSQQIFDTLINSVR